MMTAGLAVRFEHLEPNQLWSARGGDFKGHFAMDRLTQVNTGGINACGVTCYCDLSELIQSPELPRSWVLYLIRPVDALASSPRW